MQPIIIIGAARSGTKFLRGLLGAHPDCHAIPYDINFIWRLGHQQAPDDALSTEDYTPRDIAHIRQIIFRMAKVDPADRGYLIEKTVSNTLRVPLVHHIFPEARFIHLVRDGLDVVESAYRTWQEPPQIGYLFQKLRYFPLSSYRYALWYVGNMIRGRLSRKQDAPIWGPRYPGIAEDVRTKDLLTVCARQWAICVQMAHESLAKLPQDSQTTVRYESLVTEPETMARLCEFIGVEPEPVLTAHQIQTRKDCIGKGNAGLTEAQVAHIYPIIEGSRDIPIA
jgi:hypothetical protein